MRTTRTTRRTVLAAATALVLAGAVAVPAVAASGGRPAAAVAPAGTAVRAGSPDSATDRVADFYGAYIDAVSGGTGHLGDDLRAHYLTAGLRERLAAWEAVQHADGVLRAQDVPVSWSVSSDGAGAGHVFTTVDLVWGYGPHPQKSRLKVRSDLSTKLISDIQPG